MSFMTRMMARMYKLPPAETYDIAVDRDLEVPMLDGVILRADRHYPRRARGLPTILVRTPYGRSGYGAMGQLLAERGFQAVIQSCRGMDDSGGVFDPFRGEREDGLATVEWLKKQDWFDGRLGMAGPSYLGFVQWAIARDAGPALKAISTQVTSSEFYSVMYPGGAFNLDIFLGWMQTAYGMKGPALKSLWNMVMAGRRAKAAIWHLPLRDADEIVLGKHMNFWSDWLQHTGPEDDWWKAEDYSHGVADVTAPNLMISGWYDFMLPELLRDYASLLHAGRKPYLTIGPWSHSSNGMFEVSLNESLQWLRAHLLGDTKGLRKAPVRIFVMGVNEWRDMEAWPPENKPRRWYLQPEAALDTALPPDSPPDRYRYDPADPTPNVGGATNAIMGKGTCAQDNRKLEARPDVLALSSKPLAGDMEIIGTVSAELFIKSSLEHTDFFVRLCDVHPDGRSMNVCDGIRRLTPDDPVTGPDGCRKVSIDLWPTANRFKAGHRIRVQVSSGAFPRFARNLGTGEPLATGTKMKVADQQIFHDPAHPSAVILPILD